MRCGDKNREDSGWPANVSPGCGKDLHAVQYTGPTGKPSAVLICPTCDGEGFRK